MAWEVEELKSSSLGLCLSEQPSSLSSQPSDISSEATVCAHQQVLSQKQQKTSSGYVKQKMLLEGSSGARRIMRVELSGENKAGWAARSVAKVMSQNYSGEDTATQAPAPLLPLRTSCCCHHCQEGIVPIPLLLNINFYWSTICMGESRQISVQLREWWQNEHTE